MHRISQMLIVVGLVLAAAVATAHADYTNDERTTEDSPYILRPGEVRVGLLDSAVGLAGHPILRRIELGTDHLPWLFAIGDARTYNVHANVLLYRGERLALGVGAGQTYIGFEDEDVPVSIRATPIQASIAFDASRRVTLTSNVVHTRVQARGVMDDTGKVDQLWGAVGTTTTQVRTGLEMRLSSKTAIVLNARVIVGQKLYGETGASTTADGNTTVTGGAMVESRAIDMRGDISAGAAVRWSWKHLNLKAGLQYGSLNVPGLNLAIPGRRLMPKFDMFWRFN